MIKKLLLKLIEWWNTPYDIIPPYEKHGVGVLPDPKDERDYKLRSFIDDEYVPKQASIKEYTNTIRDQLYTNSCVGFALSAAYETAWNINIQDNIRISPLQIYYEARKVQGWQNEDKGCYLRDALMQSKILGLTMEQFHPFHPARVNEEPGFIANFAARYHKVTNFYRCYTLKDIKRSIANKHPVVIGMRVNNAFMRYQGNEVFRTPITDGYGHAMLIVEYSDEKQAFLMHNSWGGRWANDGYVWLDYDVFMKNYYDAWMVHVRGENNRK
jgi:cathepsin K